MAGDSRLVTENFLRLNFTARPGVTPGTNDTLAMSCDQVLSRYQVSISGVTGSGNRMPAQNQIVANVILTIGGSYGGGIIAYIYQPGDRGYIAGEQHGIITTPGDQTSSSGIPWGGSGQVTNSIYDDYGDSSYNTFLITTALGAGSYAAATSGNMIFGGYSDWGLPTRKELLRLYDNRLLIGGFQSAFYWSSTEVSSSNAYGVNFAGGAALSAGKTGFNRVRSIRYF